MLWVYIHVCTVEPLNKGPNHFVHCREVVRSSEVQNALTIWENEHLGP